MKKRTFLLFFVLLLTLITPSAYAQKAVHWEDTHQTVAHALGAINGISYTNCLEAFKENYRKGHRIFEVDIALSTDHELICLHDWYTFWKLTGHTGMNGRPTDLANFKNCSINWMYEPVTGQMLIELLQQYPDIYFVTDTKSIDAKNFKIQMNYLVQEAKKVDEKLLDRLIIQVYNNETAQALTEVYPFKNTIYTLYASPDKRNLEKISQTLQKYRIRVLTLPPELLNKPLINKMKAMNVKIFTHTINTTNEVKKQLAQGVHGFYTDSLTPYTVAHVNDPIASQNITLKVQGDIVPLEVPPFQQNGTTLVPLRSVCEALGAKVDYIQDSNTIKIIADNDIELKIGEKAVAINGESKELTLAPQVIKSTTMVPARFIAETFNLPIDWFSEEKLITLG